MAERPDQLKALAAQIRRDIVDLVQERAASISQLARAVDRPHSTVAYHVSILEAAGLLRVVRTRMVRATEERFYGRTGRTIVFPSIVGIAASDIFPGGAPPDFLSEAQAELLPGHEGLRSTLRHARVPADRAEEFFRRLAHLAEEFTRLPPEGETLFGLLVAVYPTDRPVLPSPKGSRRITKRNRG